MQGLPVRERRALARARQDVDRAMAHAQRELQATVAEIASLPPELRDHPQVVAMLAVIDQLEAADRDVMSELATHPDFGAAG
jgi:hypothetical protein